MDNVTDFIAYRKSKEQVESILNGVDTSKLSVIELGEIVKLLGKVNKQQSELLTALTNDMTLMVNRFAEMQQQFLLVSGQAYIALQMLKDKGICSPEEVETAWDHMVSEKILAPQGLDEVDQEEPHVADTPSEVLSESD